MIASEEVARHVDWHPDALPALVLGWAVADPEYIGVVTAWSRESRGERREGSNAREVAA